MVAWAKTRRLVRQAVSEQLGYAMLYSSLNLTGTDTLRCSSSNPNSQNVSKQELALLDGGRGRTIRYVFGPLPGREWWSADAQNIELRLPGYEAGEEAMVALFERPNDPPYFGSYHMLIFDLLHPEKFAEYGMKCKEVYGDTWYQWTKNGNFAVGYGSVEESGTADRTYHVPGAFRKIKGLFSKIHGKGGLNEQQIKFAERRGYVETMPDRTVDPTRGYPLLCARTNYGRIKPTVPLNYHVQGSAMWWMGKAMVRCYEYLRSLGDFRLIMQVHDELVFDFPAGSGPEPWRTNLPRIRKIKHLMEEGGRDLGVPTPVQVKYHPHNWGEGIVVAL
jgi:DNA polymerase I-like protein with 3'-5' exonuclease and polymerase domains